MSENEDFQREDSGSASDVALAWSAFYTVVTNGFFDPTEVLVQRLADDSLAAEGGGLIAQAPITAAHRLALDSLSAHARDFEASDVEAACLVVASVWQTLPKGSASQLQRCDSHFAEPQPLVCSPWFALQGQPL